MSLMVETVGFLTQGLILLQQLDDGVYARNEGPHFNGGVGKHVRHVLDHFELFLAQKDEQIDYDDRARDLDLEMGRKRAIEKCQTLIGQFNFLATQEPDLDTLLRVRHNGTWSRSTVGRELQHLINHTVHHYALMAMILRLQGIDPGADFGIAPSTLIYRKTSKLTP